jgi:hypothetical protein
MTTPASEPQRLSDEQIAELRALATELQDAAFAVRATDENEATPEMITRWDVAFSVFDDVKMCTAILALLDERERAVEALAKADLMRTAAANVLLCFEDWPKYASGYADDERRDALAMLAAAATAYRKPVSTAPSQ